jgi:hypothetical protein
MAFELQSVRTPTSIGTLQVVLVDDGTPMGKRAEFQFDVLDQNGAVIRRLNGDLVPHITQGQIDALLAFMAGLRTQAHTQVIDP